MSRSPNKKAILVLCYKRTNHLRQVISSLETAKEIEHWNVLFVAQNPTDEILNIISNSKLQDVQVIAQDYSSSELRTRGKINRNLYVGLNELFHVQECEYVVVLEDDIVIAENLLTYMDIFLNRSKRKRRFRGVNSVSAYTGDESKNYFGKYSQGLMWGWGITKEVYFKFIKFWDGNEDQHWDYFLEPFLRTGYVINPLFSLVKNIGFDSSASHTKSEPILEENINQSFAIGQQIIELEWKETKIDYRMRSDFFPISASSLRANIANMILMFISFYFFYFGLKVYRYSHYLSRSIREYCFRTVKGGSSS